MSAKGEILALPIIAFFIYILLTIVGRFPQVWNTGVKLTEANRTRVHRIVKNLINTIKLLFVFLFIYLTVSFTLLAFNIWFIPVFMTIMFSSTIYFVIKLIKAK